LFDCDHTQLEVASKPKAQGKDWENPFGAYQL
jgi:hypothetical protein